MATAPHVRVQDLPKLTDTAKVPNGELLLVTQDGEFLAPSTLYISPKLVQVLTPAEKGIARDNLGLGRLATKDTEIEDTSTKATNTWSSSKITDYVGKQMATLPRINDNGSGPNVLWSSIKVAQLVSSATANVSRIDDSAESATAVWSAAKVKAFVEAHTPRLPPIPQISDSTTTAGSLWSSTKIKQYVDAAVAAVPRGVQINDTRHTTTEVWSSSKTKTYVDTSIPNVQFDTMTTEVDFLGHVNRTWTTLRQG